MTIHLQGSQKSKMLWLPASLYNIGRMDNRHVRHKCFEAIPILDPVDVDEAYGHVASLYLSLQWHVPSHGWCYANFG